MRLTNDIKRVREKLEVFNVPGSRGVMSDLLECCVAGADNRVIDDLKRRYNKELRDLEEKQSNYKQGKLDI